MKLAIILLILTTLAFSLKYAPQTITPSHLQSSHKGIGEKVKDTVQNDTSPSKPSENITKPDDKTKPIDKNQKQPINTTKPEDKSTKPEDKSNKTENTTKPTENTTKPDDKAIKPEDKATKPEDKTKPAENASKTQNKDSKSQNSTIPKPNDTDKDKKNDDPTSNLLNCNNKGRCWMWCGDNAKITDNKDSFHKATDGKWCFTTAQNSCKTRDDCKNQTKCVDNCTARWGQ